MPRPKDPNKKVPMSIRLRPDLIKWVKDTAKKRDESESSVVGDAVEKMKKSVEAS